MDRVAHPDTVQLVIALARDTLSLSDREDLDVSPTTLLFYDLSFTSMDLLDLLFRIEERCGITISEGTLYQLARGDTPEAQFARDGVLSAAGRDHLMRLLYDTPPELFPERIHATTVPRYCTVGAIARLVDHHLGARAPSSS
jgi:acyl carrier protein